MVSVEPSWTPGSATIDRSHLTRVMSRLGLDGYDELHRWSVEDIDGFWSLVIDELSITFAVPPSSIRGSADDRRPDWLPDARFNIVDSCLDGPKNAPAIIWGSTAGTTTWSVGDLRTAVARFASGFSEAGYVPGDRIAIAMPMTPEAVIAYLGTIAAGGVVVSIADSFSADEMRARLDITEPVAVVTSDVAMRTGKVLPMYEKVADATGAPCIVIDSGADIAIRDVDVRWDSFLGANGDLATVTGPAGAHTNILFSSGTTGAPKAIPWTQTTPIKAAMDGRFHCDIHRGDVVAWPTNLGWMMGPWLVYAALLNDAAIALFHDAPTTPEFVTFVEEAGVTMLGLVPSIVSTWRARDLLGSDRWTHVRVMASTGEASNPDDYAWLMHVAGDVPVIEYCGGTEIGGGYITGTVLHPATPSRFTTPALGLDIVVVGDDGSPADVGEAFLVPPSMGMSGELVNRDHDDVYFAGTPDGLRRHGDRLERFADGTYRALGRVDDTMNLGGVKVSSAEIEDVAGAVAGVVEVAAVGVPPVGGGPDRLVVFVVAADGSAADVATLSDEVRQAVRSRLNPLFRVHDVVIVETLPRTASHKVMRRVLRDEYRA
jgi:acetyl-CoA synthetase